MGYIGSKSGDNIKQQKTLIENNQENTPIAASAVLERDALELKEIQTASCKTQLPYTPTLLAFREIMPSIRYITKLRPQSNCSQSTAAASSTRTISDSQDIQQIPDSRPNKDGKA